ncbi:relaxase/mobilization nuclease domain-containing protein [Bacteroides pyogenes]|uniref:relaxase/mobilization nuclease domain-containing protein n=1 Tax=Bacteroides pyogenes TaxID=310300 RepID=UPI002FD8C7E0
MKQQTSIHVQPVKGGSEEHNKREKELDYVRHDLSNLNEYWEKDTQTDRLATIKAKYLKTTGQKMQAKATPIREAVVVIKPETTMEDLKRLSDAYRQRFGIDTFQIAIHKDEGYPKGEWKPNLHAHLVFDWTNQETGKSIKLNRQDMVEMQTITAEVLQMDRGVSSDKQHLTAQQYKSFAEEAKLKKLEEERARKQKQMKDELERFKVAKARKEAAIETAKTLSEGVKGLFGQSSKDKEIKALKKQINGLQQLQISSKAQSIQVIEKIQLEAEKTVNSKEREYSVALAEARRQRDEAYKQSKGATEAIQFHKKRGEILTEVVCSLWEAATDAVNVLCYYLGYKHLDVSFSRDQVGKINRAMQGAKTIEEREECGRNLMKLAHSQYPNYDENSPRFKEVQGAVEEVARKENRHQQQSQSRGRGWHL